MTPIAEKLIWNLRNDARTREHFSIDDWVGLDTCNTIGCLAGTAMFMEMGDEYLFNTEGCERLRQKYDGNYVREGARILGLEYKTAQHLFFPNEDWVYDIATDPSTAFDHLPTQAKPDYVTLSNMIRFVGVNRDFPVSTDAAALALERIVKDEILYCDWAYAVENA